MVEWCQPFHCKFLDGLLAVFFTCSMVGASILLSIVYLDQQMNGGHCIVMNLNTTITQIDVPEQFNEIVCETVKIVAVTQIAIPMILIVISWVLGFNAYLVWWIFEAIIVFVETVIALIIGVIFTTTLLIFCGQLYWATKEGSCLNGAIKYDKMFFPKHGQYSDKTQLAFDHVVAVVAASWFVFFSYLFSSLLVLVRSCTRYHHEKEQKLFKSQLAEIMHYTTDARREQYPQQQYPQQRYQHQQDGDDTPLIQF